MRQTSRMSWTFFLVDVTIGCEKVPTHTTKTSSGNATADGRAPSAVLDRVVRQLEEISAAGHPELVEAMTPLPPNSIEEALCLVRQHTKPPVLEYVEYKGWLLFSNVSPDSPIRYHAGFAMRRGNPRIYRFGFW